MKRFRAIIQENALVVPDRKDTMDIDRKDLPQIEAKNLRHFFNYLKKHNIESVRKSVDPNGLKATQGHFHKEKIKNIMKSMENGENKPSPIVVSKDNYVMDGHHRWLAHANMNKAIDIYHVNIPAKQLIDTMHGYPRSFTEKLYEAFKFLSQIDETLTQVNGKWALVSKSNPSKVLQYYKGEGKPSDNWVSGVEHRIQYFKHKG